MVIRTNAVLGATAAVEVVLLHLVPGAWTSVVAPVPGALPADRAGGLLSGVLVLVATVAWSHWCLVLAATAGCGRAHARLAVRIAARIAPPGWRAAAAGCLGLAVTIAAAGGAGATDPGPARLDGLPLPDRPVGALAPTAEPGGVVTVQPGDTLWDLAAARLPAAAGDARIDRSWHAWYAANRRTVGPDPDLLLPGQQLTPPAAPERTPR